MRLGRIRKDGDNSRSNLETANTSALTLVQVSICRRAAMLDPMASKVLVSATFDSESSHTVTRPDHWHNVVVRASFSFAPLLSPRVRGVAPFFSPSF